jgi:signal transduction histidine kinase
MEERVSILGGEFQIATAPGQGMIITVTVPVSAPGTGPGSAHLSATEAIDG